MSPAISTSALSTREASALALSAPGAALAAGRSAERPDTGLDWLQRTLYSKLVCHDGTLSAPVKLAQRLLAFTELNELISQIETIERSRQLAAMAEALDICFEFKGLDNLKASADRPVILFANHPTGGGNVLGMSVLLAEHFSDYRILGNRHMNFLPSLADKLIPVDPFQSSATINLDSLLKLRQEFGTRYRALGVFPAGVSSRLSMLSGTITDRRWSDAFMRIARHHDAMLVPVWFSGRNRLRYYMAAKVRTELGFLALAAEFMNLRGQTITVNVGKPISPAMLRHIPGRRAQANFLRAAVYELGRAHGEKPAVARASRRSNVASVRTVALPQSLDGVVIGTELEARVFESTACTRIAKLADMAWRRDVAAATYHVVLTPPDRFDPRAYWQVLDWGQFTDHELDQLSPLRRTFRLPGNLAATSRNWLETVGHGAGGELHRCVNRREILLALRKLLAATRANAELVAVLSPRESNAAVASLQFAMLQKSFGDAALLPTRATVDLIGATHHHDWRPRRDIGPSGQRLRSDQMHPIDPDLRNLAKIGVRFGAFGLSADTCPRPCILGRLVATPIPFADPRADK
jgi:putative hemolysin